MNFFVFFALLVSLLCIRSESDDISSTAASIKSSSSSSSASSKFSSGSLTVSWVVSADKSNVTFTTSLSASGYMSIGFSTSTRMTPLYGTMIGYVNSAGAAVYNIGYINDYNNVKSDSKQSIKLLSASNSGGVQTMVWVKQIAAQDSNDMDLSSATYIVWAYHSSSTSFSQKHTADGSTGVNILTGAVSNVANAAELFIIKWIPTLVIVLITLVSPVMGAPQWENGKLIFWSVWIASWIAFYALCYFMNYELYFISSGRAVFMAMAVSVVPISRTSFLVWAFNLPFERAVVFHVYLGIFSLLMTGVHIIFVLVDFKQGNLGIIDTLIDITPTGDNVIILAGTIAALGMLVMYLMSFIRRFAWEWFYYIHKGLALVVIVSSMIHAFSATVALLVVPIVLYAWDLYFRFSGSFQSVKIKQLQTMGDVTKIVMQPVNRPEFHHFEPGSYAFINIPDLGIAWHPFSIASPPGQSVLTFYIKDMGKGTWTNKLLIESRRYGGEGEEADDGELTPSLDRATSGERGRNRSINPVRRPSVGSFNCYIYGPYGHLSIPLLDPNRRAIALFAGGIGITPFMSIFQYIAEQKRNNNLVMLREVYLFWITRGDITMADEIQDVCSQNSGFYFFSFNSTKGPRPTIVELTQKYITSRSGRGKDIAVLACGPQKMIDDVEKVATECEFSFHKETFLF